jgi:hypothetical protein
MLIFINYQRILFREILGPWKNRTESTIFICLLFTLLSAKFIPLLTSSCWCSKFVTIDTLTSNVLANSVTIDNFDILILTEE